MQCFLSTQSVFTGWVHRPLTTTPVLRPFVWDYPGEPVPEETFTNSTSMYKLAFGYLR